MLFNGDKMTVFGAFTPAAIDDGVIGNNTLWSSKGIIDALCPAIDENDNVVQCEPVAGYPLQVRSYFEEHVSAGEKLTLTRCGKNLYNKDAFPLTPKKLLREAGSIVSSDNFAICEGYIPVKHLQGKTIMLNHAPNEMGSTSARSLFYDSDKNVIANSEKGKMEVPAGAHYFRFTTRIEYADGAAIQIEIGGTVTEYEAYDGESWSVDLQETDSPVMFDWTSGIFHTDGYDSQLLEEPPAILGKAGVNTFYSNLGGTEIFGRGDIAKRIEQLEAAVISMGSNV